MTSESQNIKNTSSLDTAYDEHSRQKCSRHFKDQAVSPKSTEQNVNGKKRSRSDSHERTPTASSSTHHSFDEEDRNYNANKRNKFLAKRKDRPSRRDEHRSYSGHHNRFPREDTECDIPPEYDPSATKNLYVGNLDDSVDINYLLRVFERYGIVETIDIKRPSRDAAYAFVTMTTLNMAYKAKTKLAEKYIGQSRCKIGYGRIIPTTAVWIGSLNAQMEEEEIKNMFDRFGRILKIDYRRGAKEAQIWYKSVDEATEAANKMRGRLLPGSKKRLRTDFGDKSFSRYMKQRSPSPDNDVEIVSMYRQNFSDVLKQSSKWEGDFILKKQKHPVKLQLLESNKKNVDNLLKNSNQLEITHKMKLKLPILDNIQNIISKNTFYQIFLGLPNMEDNTKRPLSELVTYLKVNSVAGFIHLLDGEGVLLGFLYVFPVCDFALNLIRRTYEVSENEICDFLVCVSVLRP